MRSRGDLTGERLCLGNGGLDDREVAARRLHRQGGRDVGRLRDPSRVIDDERSVSDRDAVRRDQRQSVLRLELERRYSGASERLTARQGVSPVLGATDADGDLRHAGHLPDVAGADRRRLRHQGMDAGVHHRDQHVRGGSACTRAAARDAVEPGGQRRAHDPGRQRCTKPARVRHDEVALLANQLLLGQELVLAVADLRRQAVDGVATGERGHDHCVTRGDLQARFL